MAEHAAGGTAWCTRVWSHKLAAAAGCYNRTARTGMLHAACCSPAAYPWHGLRPAATRQCRLARSSLQDMLHALHLSCTLCPAVLQVVHSPLSGLPSPADGDGDAEDAAAASGRLFLRNLAFTVSEAELSDLFGEYGALQEVHLVLDRRAVPPLTAR